MADQLEDELREAYSQLPGDLTDRREVMARSYRRAAGLRRRRTVSVCAGTTAAALVLGGAVMVGGSLGAAPRETTLLPAGGGAASTAAPTSSPAVSTPDAHTASARPTGLAKTSEATKGTLPPEGTDKPLAGLSGTLLPHGSQLPAGMTYHGMNTEDYKQTWTTSKEDGYKNAVPLLIMTGADQNFDAPSNAETNAAYGIVAGVTDSFDAPGIGDTSPRYRSVESSIVRFRSAADAKVALAKTQRKEDGLYWVMTNLTQPNVSWSGVPGVTGDHGVFHLANDLPAPSYVVYQIVGPYIVSANGFEKGHAEQAVVDMVGNLKTTGLIK